MLSSLLPRIFKRIKLPTYPYRQYMHRHRCIFIHIPKNAGSSILSSLGHVGGRDHVEWRHYRGCNSRWFESYFKFAICREPFARLYSAYSYALKGGNQSSNDVELKNYIAENSNGYDDFVKRILQNDFINENVLFKQQYLFICTRDLSLVVDKVLRFETLTEDWNKLAKEKGLPQTLPTVNAVSSTEAEIPALSESAIEKVKELYAKDFKIFGYPT